MRVGRIRRELASALSEKLGFPVCPEDLRSTGKHDPNRNRWETLFRSRSGDLVSVESWFTMKECLEHGFELRGGPVSFEVRLLPGHLKKRP